MSAQTWYLEPEPPRRPEWKDALLAIIILAGVCLLFKLMAAFA